MNLQVLGIKQLDNTLDILIRVNYISYRYAKESINRSRSYIQAKFKCPKGFEIDRDKIRNDHYRIFYVKQNRINTNPQTYAFDNYVVPYSQPLQWMQDLR